MLLTEGEDFQPVIRNITFLPQQSTTQEVPLEIVNDDREEGNENLIIFVKDVTGQQVSPVPINITIIDDDTGAYLNAKCLAKHYFYCVNYSENYNGFLTPPFNLSC